MSRKLRVFVSYSEKDKHQLGNIYPLESESIRLWIDEEEIRAGDKILEKLNQAIHDCDVCLFLLTANSQSSNWCKCEVAAFWGAKKPIIVWECDSGSFDVSELKPLNGIRRAKNLKEIKEALNSKTIRSSLRKTTLGELPAPEAMKIFRDTLTKSMSQVNDKIEKMSSLMPLTENSLFGRRHKHFFHEKRAIARMFISEIERIIDKQTIETGHASLRLLLDSGTTIFPIFNLLMERKKDPKFVESLEIVTNNIPGVIVALRDGKISDEDHYSGLAYNTLAVSGKPLPAFWAVLPENPKESLRRALERPYRGGDRKCLTIGVTTSNYLSDTGKSLFVRTEGHLDFKKEIIRNSDIVFMLFPVGKMLDASAEDLNNCIVPDAERKNPDRIYREMPIDIGVGRELVFLTTRRTANDLLYKHFVCIEANLQKVEKEFGVSGKKVRTIYVNESEFRISRLCGNSGIETEEDMEMPHAHHRSHLRRWLHLK